MNELADKVAVVTGGGRGIGRAAALGYARAGAKVVIAARTQSELMAVEKEISNGGGEVLSTQTDISREEDVGRLISRVMKLWGRVDILLNNAGIPGPQGLIHELDMSEVARTWAINIQGQFICCHLITPVMLKQGGGNIINVSSAAGQCIPRSRVRSLPYQISKFAIEGLTNALAVQFRGNKINVNALQPGMIGTQFHDATPAQWITGKQMGRPEDVVPAAIFLASLAPGAMTGFSLEARAFNRGFRPELRDYTLA